MEHKAKQKPINNKVMFYTGLTYFIVLLSFVALRIIFSVVDFGDISAVWRDRLFTIIAQLLIMGFIPIVLICLFTKQNNKATLERFSIKGVSPSTVGYSFLLGIVVFFLTLIISSFFNGIIGFFGYQSSSGSVVTSESPELYFVLSVLFTAILPALFEELTHRGMLLGGMMTGGNAVRAIVLSGLLFGLMHLNIEQFFFAAVVGMLLAHLTIFTRSIWPAVIVHFTNNFISEYLKHAKYNDWFGSGFYPAINNFFNSTSFILVFLASFLVIALVTIAIFMLLIRLFVERKKTDFKQFVKKFKREMAFTEHVDSIDFNNQELMLSYYRQVELARTQAEARANNMTYEEYNSMLAKRGLIASIMPSSGVKLTKPTFWENFFFYASLILGGIVTIFTLVWGML